MTKTVNILGTEYEIIRKRKEDEPKLEDSYGYTEPYSKKIVIATFEEEIKQPDTVENFEEFVKKVIRHETIHAFFGESGLQNNSDYAENEELVDWIAIQAPKMFKVWQELGVL